MFKIIFLIVTISSFVHSERLRFDNYHAYTVTPKNLAEIQVLQEFEGPGDSIIFITVLSDGMIGKKISILVGPKKQSKFTKQLDKNRISYTLVERNIQYELDAEIERQRSCTNRKEYGWTCYHTLDETYNWFDKLCTHYPKELTQFKAGRTFEGRDIRGIKLSYKSGNKAIVIEGGMSGRQWMSPATVTYILNQLLTSTDPKIRDVAINYDWYIIPFINADGYHYTQTTNRFWRKSRSNNGNCCLGADLNRNWNSKWGQSGISHNPCSVVYPGLHPNSEIEIKTYSKFLRTIKNLRTYLSIHSITQMILTPYGYTSKHPQTYDDLVKIGNTAKTLLAQRYGTQYKVGSYYEALYPAAGTSMDWAYNKLGVLLSYSLQLGAIGNYNEWNVHIQPASEIIPNGRQSVDAIVTLVCEGKKLGYYD